jgi:nicotinamide/nicotinate riboside kinase
MTAIQSQSSLQPLLIGIGGSSCSGKSTLSAYLRHLLNGKIIQQDYFFKKDDEIPLANNIKNWDCPEAIDFDKFIASLKDLQENLGKNNNTFTKTITAEMNALAADIKSITAATMFFVDGFLLYSNETVINLLDIKFFLKSGFDTLKARRDARDAYITLDGCWKDPPGYFQDIVYPNYLKFNENAENICVVIDTENGIEMMVIQALKVILQKVAIKYRSGKF